LTIQDLGSIGEFIAAIATVATLVYLAVQIRQSTKQARLTANRELGASIHDGFAPLFNPGFARIWRLGRYDPDQLDEDERAAFGMLLERQLYSFQNVVHQYDNGVLEQDTFESMVVLFSDLVSTPGGVAYWSKNSSKFSPAVRAHFDGVA
jgi:hypothetical protein